MKEKIWKGKPKYAILLIVILFLTLAIGASIILSLDDLLQDKEIDYVDVVVADKYINNDTSHYYVIVSQDGSLFDIVNITNSKNLFDRISIGEEYRFVTKKPFSIDDKYIHIVQVHDGSN